VQASWLSLRFLSTIHRKCGSGAVWQCRENKVVPHHVWSICAVFNEEAHVPRLLVNHSPKEPWYTAPVSLIIKAISRSGWSPGAPIQTLIRSYLSKHWFLNIRWLRLFPRLIEYYTPLKPVTYFNKLHRVMARDTHKYICVTSRSNNRST
jgi:hypothetical protein